MEYQGQGLDGRGVGLLRGDRPFKQFASAGTREAVAAGRFGLGKACSSVGNLNKSLGREGAV